MIRETPDLVMLLDLTLASLEFERALGQGFSARDTFFEAVDLLRSYRGIGPWLYGGAAHVAWTAVHLSRRLGRPIKGLEQLDDMILSWIADFPADEDVDLPRGLLGLGVYALVHPSEAVREKMTAGVLAVVAERAEQDGDGGVFVRLAAGESRLRLKPQTVGHRDLGVAHGNAGLVSYLGSVAMSGLACASDAARLLDPSLAWLLRQRSALDGFVFPSSVENRYEPSRTAWCYGDPGAALALAVAAHATGSGEAAVAAREAAASAVARPPARAGVVDASLCHGAAGLCWFSRRAEEDWGLPGSADLAEHWAARIRDERENGPLHYVGLGGSRRDPSFLDGDLGAALGLLYLATGVKPIWEERLLASPVSAVAV